MKTRIIGAIVAVLLAVAGSVVLVLYVGAADARAANGAKLVDAYVVSSEIPAQTAGETVASYLSVAQIPASSVVDGAVTDLSTLDGLVASVSLEPGEQLLASRWIDPAAVAGTGEVTLPEGFQAVTLALDVERAVGGAIEPGDTVGVVLSADQPYVENPGMTQEQLHKVLVLATTPGVQLATSDAVPDEDRVAQVMVTLALRTPDLEKVVWAQEWGKVRLTLEPAAAADEQGSRPVNGGVVFP